MVKELNDNEIKNASGSLGLHINYETFKKLGLTLHDCYYHCESYTPCGDALRHIEHGYEVDPMCIFCLYAAMIEGVYDGNGEGAEYYGNIGCLLKM